MNINFGSASLIPVDTVTHAGIELHKSQKFSSAVEARIRKGRSSLFPILSIDETPGEVNP
jgi:hypothetical protein